MAQPAPQSWQRHRGGRRREHPRRPERGAVAQPVSRLEGLHDPRGRGMSLEREVESLLYRQSEYLDSKAWDQYIDLFAEDGLYWMPPAPHYTTWEGQPSIF